MDDSGSPVTGLGIGSFELLFVTREKAANNPTQFLPAAILAPLQSASESPPKTGFYELRLDWSKLHAMTSDFVFRIFVRRQKGADKLSSDRGQVVLSYHSSAS